MKAGLEKLIRGAQLAHRAFHPAGRPRIPYAIVGGGAISFLGSGRKTSELDFHYCASLPSTETAVLSSFRDEGYTLTSHPLAAGWMGKPDPEGSLGAAGAATLPRIDVRPQTHLWPLMDLHTIKHPMGFYHADEPVLTLLKIAAIATREPHVGAGKHEELNGKVKTDFRDLEFLLDRMVKEGKRVGGELQSAILDRGGEEKGGLWEEFWKRTESYGPKESGDLQSLFGKVNVKFEEPK